MTARYPDFNSAISSGRWRNGLETPTSILCASGVQFNRGLVIVGCTCQDLIESCLPYNELKVPPKKEALRAIPPAWLTAIHVLF